jgi:hypothetical protein
MSTIEQENEKEFENLNKIINGIKDEFTLFKSYTTSHIEKNEKLLYITRKDIINNKREIQEIKTNTRNMKIKSNTFIALKQIMLDNKRRKYIIKKSIKKWKHNILYDGFVNWKNYNITQQKEIENNNNHETEQKFDHISLQISTLHEFIENLNILKADKQEVARVERNVDVDSIRQVFTDMRDYVDT